MRRRDFFGVLSGVAVAAVPLFARAQQSGKVYRVALVSPSMLLSEINETDPVYGPFFDELRRLGYSEGQNLVIERFSAEGHAERYREMVSNVVRGRPDAVAAFQTQLVLELKAQTTTIPIVGGFIDPVGSGIVQSLARPGGNITGVDGDAGLQTWGKRLALLKEAIPKLSRVGLLIVPNLYGQRGAVMVKEVSEKIGVSLLDSQLASPFDETAYRRAFATMVQEHAEAVYVGNQVENWTSRRLIVDLAQQHGLPAIYAFFRTVEIGGLISYTPDWDDVWRHTADQIDQVLKGTNAGDIPVYQARNFKLAINLKTAKALGIEIPTSLLAQADEVVE
jgi:putative tryptophan/tyrosine transport system substrate-binding protein